ncbi:biosynthetic-type acetolactate synthase large subunit [Solimonas terrae]|uniref:Acetolactate synthase n=1 Tax=Solimonas terrae TaxID=1396819 RepID=A0A6M2BXB7_9GAMM|nr:biosynthetic-type acetolactate synthase large subunit [Solimonas terrae]NGY06935.1 biosynthetic-type acetolactate synthase large subunit [Solimonas terrae]
MDINGANLITRFLEARMDALGASAGIVAGIPGGALLPLYRALADSRLTHVLARHEQGAGFIAQGIARVSGHAGVCLATSGPGLTNTVTALADAKADSVPLVCFAGQVPRALIGSDAFQEVRTGHIVDSITKAHFELRAAADLVHLLPEAFRIAESGRPGPVLIELPKDVQTEALQLDKLPLPCAVARAGEPGADAIARAAAMIARARRPVLYLGGGVVQARAQHLAQTFAERAGLPTTTTLMALGTMPPDHPLALGMLGLHGARYTNRVIDECDLLIAIGCRFDDRATGRLDRFAPNARVIHIDADRRELGKLRKPQLAIEADAGAALRALIKAVTPQLRTDWLARVGSLHRESPMPRPGADDPRKPHGLMRAVAAIADPDAAITTDVGQHQMWVAQSYPLTHRATGETMADSLSTPHRWLTSGGLGTMGFGVPAAIGAALVNPQAGAICFSGDGSLMMSVQELATLAELQANVKIIVMDNGALGMVRQQQNQFWDGRYSASLYRHPPSCCAVAEAFGVPAIDLGFARDPLQALRSAFAQPGPMLIRAPIAVEEMVLPVVVPGGANVEALG